MASEVDICNLALGHIRAGSIGSLNDSSQPAKLCKNLYPILRDRCLRELPWHFNRKVKALSRLEGTKILQFAYGLHLEGREHHSVQ
jgi:hypothetical protein